MVYLGNHLKNQVDCSKKDVNYFIRKFSSAIRRMNNDKVGSTTYSIFLSKEGIFEIDSNEQGEFKVQEIMK